MSERTDEALERVDASGVSEDDGKSDGASPDEERREELFPEDTGTCPLPVRHAIAALVKRRYISADEDRTAWEGLMSDPELVRSRLSDVLLVLKLDTVAGVALAQQVELEDDTVPYKIKSVNYFNNVQSLLMTQLVTKYFSATAAGETLVWIEYDEMREYLGRLFEDAPDIAFTEQSIRQAVGAMVRNHYLREVAEDRYQVMPVVGVVYTIDEIKAVLQRYVSRETEGGQREAEGGTSETEGSRREADADGHEVASANRQRTSARRVPQPESLVLDFADADDADVAER